MDANNYREVICNPWSWFFAAEVLFKNANELYDLYIERHEAILNYLKEQSSAKTNEDDYNCNAKSLQRLSSNTHILPIFLMLMGMAIEDMAKCITVARKLKLNNDIINTATLKKLGVSGHCAPALINELGIKITPIEEALLNDANDHLIWAGRYAAPANENKQLSCDTIMYMTPGEIKKDKCLETLVQLYNRLKSIYLKEADEPQMKEWLLSRHFRVIR